MRLAALRIVGSLLLSSYICFILCVFVPFVYCFDVGRAVALPLHDRASMEYGSSFLDYAGLATHL